MVTKTGKVELHQLTGTGYMALGFGIVLCGARVCVNSIAPRGIGAFDPATGKFDVAAVKAKAEGGTLIVADNYLWQICSDGASNTSWVVRRPVTSMAAAFSTVGRTYPSANALDSLAASKDGAVWVLVTGDGGPRVERVAPAPAGRSASGPLAVANVSLALPTAWAPYLMARGPAGSLYLVVEVAGGAYELLQLPLHVGARPRPLVRLPAAPADLFTASDDAAWLCGDGWVMRYDPADGSHRLTGDKSHSFKYVAEGVGGRMFLVRSPAGKAGCDILMFKESPDGGIGPDTAVADPSLISGLAPDGHDGFWFVSAHESHGTAIYSMGHFTPATCDPLVDC